MLFVIYRLLQPLQVLCIRVRERLVEILDQRIQIGQMDRLLLHSLIPLAHRQRHLALTHIAAENRVALVQRLAHRFEDLVEVLLAAAKPGRAKEEDVFAVQLLQKGGGVLVRLPLIRPEAHIEGVGFQGGRVRPAEVHAPLLRQAFVKGVCQHFGVAGLAAEYDRVAHGFSFPEACSVPFCSS